MIAGLLLIAATHFVEVPPARVLLVVLAPPQPSQLEEISSREISKTADAVFREVAYVEVVSPEELDLSTADFEACSVDVRSSCWVKLALRTQGAPRVLVILSLQPDRAAALAAFDLAAAARALAGERSGGEENAERAIWNLATRLPRDTIARETLRAYFERSVRSELGALLAKVSSRNAFGELVIDGVSPGSELELDGKSVGVATSSVAAIEGVAAGTRRVRVRRPSGESADAIAGVRGRTIAHATIVFAEQRAMSPAVQIGLGGAGVVAGASLLVALALTGADEAVCIHRSDASECSGRPPVFEPGPGGVSVAGGDRGAPLFAVFGAGLIGAGAAWSIGSWTKEDAPIWALALVSVLAGAAASGSAYLLLH